MISPTTILHGTATRAALLLPIFITLITALAIGGVFFNSLILLALVASMIITEAIYTKILKKKKQLQKQSKKLRRAEIATLLIISIITLATAILHAEFPRGRDNAVYRTTAVEMTQTHSLKFDATIFTPLHGFRPIPGQPHYITTPQFLPGYPTFLGAGYALAGPWGIIVANALLFALTLLAITAIAATLAPKQPKLTLALPIIISTLYPVVWFSRQTVSENLLAALFWASAYLITLGIQKKSSQHILLSLIPTSATLLVRGEAIAYLIIAIITIGTLHFTTKQNPSRPALAFTITAAIANITITTWYAITHGANYLTSTLGTASDMLQNPKILIALTIISVIAIATIKHHDHQFSSKALRLTKRFFGITLLLSLILGTTTITDYQLPIGDITPWTLFKAQLLTGAIIQYGLAPLIILLAIGLHRSSPILPLAITILAAPSFLYIINPAIAVDQPWYTRRFLPILIPLLTLTALLSLKDLPTQFQKTIPAILIISNLLVTSPILFLKENNGIEQQFTKLSQIASPYDLILMEPGWHWQQWAFGIHSLEHLNILPNLDDITKEQLQNEIADADRVFIMTTSPSTPYPNITPEQLTKIADIEFGPYPKLEPTVWIASYVDKNKHKLETRVLQKELTAIRPTQVIVPTEPYIIYELDTSTLQIEQLR